MKFVTGDRIEVVNSIFEGERGRVIRVYGNIVEVRLDGTYKSQILNIARLRPVDVISRLSELACD